MADGMKLFVDVYLFDHQLVLSNGFRKGSRPPGVFYHLKTTAADAASTPQPPLAAC